MSGLHRRRTTLGSLAVLALCAGWIAGGRGARVAAQAVADALDPALVSAFK